MSAPRTPAHAVAQLSIHDRARYDRYARAFLPTLAPFAGRELAEGFGAP